MELRHLLYFLAVGEALNFTKAAAQLRVAQPALSPQMQDLEDEIGVDLLRRSPRDATLTTACSRQSHRKMPALFIITPTGRNLNKTISLCSKQHQSS
jgi:hypothetical protein